MLLLWYVSVGNEIIYLYGTYWASSYFGSKRRELIRKTFLSYIDKDVFMSTGYIAFVVDIIVNTFIMLDSIQL